MKNFEIIAVQEHKEDKHPCSLQILFGKVKYATLWADHTITFNSEMDFDIEEVAWFLKVNEMFYSFFNNVKTNRTTTSKTGLERTFYKLTELGKTIQL